MIQHFMLGIEMRKYSKAKNHVLSSDNLPKLTIKHIKIEEAYSSDVFKDDRGFLTPLVDEDKFNEVMKGFIGKITQLPPVRSA